MRHGQDGQQPPEVVGVPEGPDRTDVDEGEDQPTCEEALRDAPPRQQEAREPEEPDKLAPPPPPAPAPAAKGPPRTTHRPAPPPVPSTRSPNTSSGPSLLIVASAASAGVSTAPTPARLHADA